MANVLSETKRQQVIALGRLGWPLRRIEAEIGVRRETASAYLRSAGVPIRAERRRQLPAKPASGDQVSPDSAVAKPASGSQVSTDPSPSRAPRASACEPYREVITAAIGRGRNAMAIYQELVDGHGFAARYASVRRFVRGLRAGRDPVPRAIITTPPGEEAQVDYGEGPMLRDPATGKYRRCRLFVLTLGHSRKSVRLLTRRSSARIWAELHEEAFRRLGGAPRVVVLDNLKEGVLRAEWYDPTLNPLYRDVLAHYGVTPLPCRVRDPDRKGKVEAAVGHAQRTPLKGLRFETLEAAQAYLDHWETRWADTRIHGTTKRQVAAMFAEERPHLQPLPLEPFRYYTHGTRVVHVDGHVEVDRAYYSAPPGRIGTTVAVQWDGHVVRLLDLHTGALLREHRVDGPGRHRTRAEDRPPHTSPSLQQLVHRAQQVAPAIGVLCQQIAAREGVLGSRRILGVLALARRHGPEAVNEACAASCDLGQPTYRFVRRYLERVPRPPLALRQIDPLIRELTQYRDLIAARSAPAPEDPT
ncbi:MAG TPA: IS21 family transposase [Polyangiaceae bacterium]